MPTTTKPLAGVRVLELARILAGPWAGQVLADLGADVIKVESPTGDDTRSWGPPFVERDNGDKDAAYFFSCNRGKRSTVVDFKTNEGQAEVRRLAEQADVVIENFKVGGLAQYELDYHHLQKLNPRLIYCSITGFGQNGPYADQAGYDFIIQGLSGIMDLTGEPHQAPQKIGVAYADIFTGLYSVIAIQAALRQRETTGCGQHIDMALLDSMVGVLGNQALNYLVSGVSPTRMGNKHPNIAPYESFATKDSWVIIAVGNNKQFKLLCQELGMANLLDDQRFESNAQRLNHRNELSQLVASACAKFSTTELVDKLSKQGVPTSPINSVEQALNNPQTQHRGMVLGDPSIKSEPGGIRTPIRSSAYTTDTQQTSPRLNEHPKPNWK